MKHLDLFCSYLSILHNEGLVISWLQFLMYLKIKSWLFCYELCSMQSSIESPANFQCNMIFINFFWSLVKTLFFTFDPVDFYMMEFSKDEFRLSGPALWTQWLFHDPNFLFIDQQKVGPQTLACCPMLISCFVGLY